MYIFKVCNLIVLMGVYTLGTIQKPSSFCSHSQQARLPWAHPAPSPPRRSVALPDEADDTRPHLAVYG